MARAVKAIELIWPDLVIKRAGAKQTWQTWRAVPFAQQHELLVYKSSEHAGKWKALGADPSLTDTMVHLLRGDRELTIVIDNPDSAEMRRFLLSMQPGLPGVLDSYHLSHKRGQAVAL